MTYDGYKDCKQCGKTFKKSNNLTIKVWLEKTKYCSRLCADKGSIGRTRDGVIRKPTPRVSDWNRYHRLHSWVKKNLGAASYCSADQSHQAKRYHWSNISQEYKWDLSDFRPLCPKCHYEIDKSPHVAEIMRKKSKGNENHNKPIIRLDYANKISIRFKSTKEAALYTGTGRTNITNALSNYTKTAAGYKWQRVTV